MSTRKVVCLVSVTISEWFISLFWLEKQSFDEIFLLHIRSFLRSDHDTHTSVSWFNMHTSDDGLIAMGFVTISLGAKNYF